MKKMLIILCGLALLLAGATAVWLLAAQASGDSWAAALALIPAGIAALNLLVLLALLGNARPQPWAFYLLAALDALGAALMAKFWSAISFQVGDIWTIAAPVIAVLLVKAVLSVLVARQLPRG